MCQETSKYLSIVCIVFLHIDLTCLVIKKSCQFHTLVFPIGGDDSLLSLGKPCLLDSLVIPYHGFIFIENTGDFLVQSSEAFFQLFQTFFERFLLDRVSLCQCISRTGIAQLQAVKDISHSTFTEIDSEVFLYIFAGQWCCPITKRSQAYVLWQFLRDCLVQFCFLLGVQFPFTPLGFPQNQTFYALCSVSIQYIVYPL